MLDPIEAFLADYLLDRSARLVQNEASTGAYFKSRVAEQKVLQIVIVEALAALFAIHA